ncbi:MAG: hypothetical protein WAV67_12715 [Dokdonella sp.]
MKLELFFIRSLFILVTVAVIGVMGGMLHSNAVQAHKIAQTNVAAAHAG